MLTLFAVRAVQTLPVKWREPTDYLVVGLCALMDCLLVAGAVLTLGAWL